MAGWRTVFVVIVFTVFFFFSTASALTANYSKNGNAFSSASGQYAMIGHCSDSVCGWVAGNEVIVGVYSSYFGSWTGGSVSWNFNVTQPLDQIQSAQLKIAWPSSYGKGLHSVGQNTTSTVKVGGSTVASPSTSTAYSCGTGDRYAYPCFDFLKTYTVPVSAISGNTAVTVSVPGNTFWDIGTVTLVIEYGSVTPICSKNSDCGTDGWIAGTASCSGNDVYQTWRAFTCNNPGTASASCSQSDTQKLKQDCGDTTYDAWGANYCNGNNVEKSRTVHNKGCSAATCTASDSIEKQTVQTCQYGCSAGACITPKCMQNSDCGTNGFTGSAFCQNGNAYQNYIAYTCNNPGTSSASCSNSTTAQLKQTCTNGCTNGTCNANSNGITIANGKIKIGGADFLVKGIDYAPWLKDTGPEQWHQPLPGEYDDVTDKVTNNGTRWVKDYSGDGKIQMWEVIRYDIEVMKGEGVNTIHTYASGEWHDRDLDNVRDSGEIAKGDLPDWAIDRILQYANDNGMKVIIGYWVQEEDLKPQSMNCDGKTKPYVCNWDDLVVAKKTLGRIMQKYKSNPAVLAWGIGNEVNGVFNHDWFCWGVSVNDYLNALFDYAKTQDTAHPIIYAKYIGENTNFNNMHADIMAINAYLFSANDLVNTYHEFSISAPAGKAYLLGEYGHVLDHAQGHWELAKQYAGGCFLEFNNVWWKGSGHNLLGTVDEYRHIIPDRFNKVKNLYGGAGFNEQPVGGIACTQNSDCGTNGFTGSAFCQNGNVYQNYITYTCNNPGTSSASCSNSTTAQLKQTCTNGCTNGTCNAAPSPEPAWKSMNFYESFDTIGGLVSGGWSLQGNPQKVSGIQNGATSFGQEASATHALNGIFNPNIGTIEFSFNFPASVTNNPGVGLLEIGMLGQPNSMGLFVIPYSGKNVAIMEVRDSANKLTQSWTKTTIVAPNAWHQVVLTWQCNQKSNYVKIYFDGTAGSTNNNACASFNPAGILRIAKVSSYYDKKPILLDDLRIYNYIKSSSQIAKDYKYKVNAMWPNLIGPANGAVINKSQVFSWKANTFTKFQIELSQNSDFANPTAITGWISGTSTTLSEYWKTIQDMSANDSDKVLYWRVVGLRPQDTEYSEGNAFKIQ